MEDTFREPYVSPECLILAGILAQRVLAGSVAGSNIEVVEYEDL